MLDNRIVIADVETFGLNHMEDPIIEVGFGIYNLDFHKIDDFQLTVWDSGLYDERYNKLINDANENPDGGAAYVLKMHTDSGLFEEAQAKGLDPFTAEEKITGWLFAHGVKDPEPMVGSSIHFDRDAFAEQMPLVNKHFGYRMLDVSSLKMTWAAFFPAISAELGTVWPSRKRHRVLDDIEDTARELEYYVRSIVKVTVPR